MMETTTDNTNHTEFFREYTAQEAILKYSRTTAGFGISYLLEHDYKTVYLDALALLPRELKQRGVRLLDFGCGAGMNLIHLVSTLSRDGIRVAKAVGTDFSPVLIDAAKREARSQLGGEQQTKIEFHVAKNETLIEDLCMASNTNRAGLKGSFDFILGVNTIRYCHRAGTELDCAHDILDLLAPGGLCVVIDMNDRFLFFRNTWRNRLRGQRENEALSYLPSLEEYSASFRKVGFQVLRSENFCWIPHSSGPVMCRMLSAISWLLNGLIRSRAMRSLVIARRPVSVDSR